MNSAEKSVRLSRKRLQRHIEAFLATFQNKETKGTYERCLREFVRWFGREKEFRFRTKDVERYKKYLTTKKRFSEVSVSTYLTALRRLCFFLVAENVLAMNPAKLVDGNKRPKTHSRAVLSEVSVQRLLSLLTFESELELRNATIILLMLECGLSESEIVTANVEDFKRVDGASVLAVQGKGKMSKEATVVLPPNVLSALEQYLVERNRLYEKLRTGAPLLLSAGNRTRGERMSTRGLREIVNRYLRAAGIKEKGISPHSLRHTSARRLADAGAGADEIRQKMRLGTIATAEMYLRSVVQAA